MELEATGPGCGCCVLRLREEKSRREEEKVSCLLCVGVQRTGAVLDCWRCACLWC